MNLHQDRTKRFDEALDSAAHCASELSYSRSRLAHAHAAAALVMHTEADPELVAAAMLHDAADGAIDDERINLIASRFGERVARVVAWCSENGTHPLPPFRGLDEPRIAELLCAPRDVMIVAAADTVAAVRSLIAELARGPVDAVASRVHAATMSWFMHEASVAFADRLRGHRLAFEVSSAVEALRFRLPRATRLSAAG